MKLTNAQWEAVEDFIPEHERNLKKKGRPWVSPRKILDGILWIVKTGARWCDLPENYPSYQICHRRFQKWVHAGIFEKIISLFLSPLACRVLHDMRVSSLIKQLGPALQLTFLRELWVTKHTILIHLT